MSTAVAHWSSRIGRLEIGEVQLDLRYRCVSHPDGNVELPQRMFDLLLLFAAEPGVLHTRRDLFRRVWSGVVVEDGNLSQSVWMLRKALGPERRQWIRTVAKSGYVFEPPHPVVPVAVDEVLEQAAGTGGSSLPATPLAPARAGRHLTGRLTRQFGLAGGAVVALAMIVMVAATGSRLAPPASESASTSTSSRTPIPAIPGADPAATKASLPQVMLIAVDDIGRPESAGNDLAGTDALANANANAPEAITSLLLGWLRWQLAMTPQVQLLEPGLAEGFDADPQAIVVLLASRYLPVDTGTAGPLPTGSWPAVPDGGSGASGQLRIRAWLRTPDGSHQVRVQGPAETVAALVEQVAEGIMAQLLPAGAQRPSQAGSAIPVDPEGIALYRQLLLASQARQWPAVVGIGTRLVAQAPGFGLAHWHLAQAHGRLHQHRQAREHLRVAQALLAPTGAAAEQFQARALAWSGEYDRAAAIYQGLAARHPQQAGFILARAQALQAAGQHQAAADVLAAIDLPRQSAAVQVGQQLLLADIAWAIDDADAARAAALRAGQLSAAAGWPLETERARQLYVRSGGVVPESGAAGFDGITLAQNRDQAPSPTMAPWHTLKLVAETPATGCPAPGAF